MVILLINLAEVPCGFLFTNCEIHRDVYFLTTFSKLLQIVNVNFSIPVYFCLSVPPLFPFLSRSYSHSFALSLTTFYPILFKATSLNQIRTSWRVTLTHCFETGVLCLYCSIVIGLGLTQTGRVDPFSQINHLLNHVLMPSSLASNTSLLPSTSLHCSLRVGLYPLPLPLILPSPPPLPPDTCHRPDAGVRNADT